MLFVSLSINHINQMSSVCPAFIGKTDVSSTSGSSRIFLHSFDRCSVIAYPGQGIVPGAGAPVVDIGSGLATYRA